MEPSNTSSRTKDLLRRFLHEAQRCGEEPNVAAEDLPRGFRQIDDVILLLQPVRVLPAEDDRETLHRTLHHLAEKNFLTGTEALAQRGIWAALVCGCARHARGFHLELTENEGADIEQALLMERPASVLVSTRPKAHLPLANFVERAGHFTAEAIGRVTAGELRVRWMGETVLEAASFDALTR